MTLINSFFDERNASENVMRKMNATHGFQMKVIMNYGSVHNNFEQ